MVIIIGLSKWEQYLSTMFGEGIIIMKAETRVFCSMYIAFPLSKSKLNKTAWWMCCLLDDGTSFWVAAGTLYPWIKKKRPCVQCGCVLYSGDFETPKWTWPCFSFHHSRVLLFSSSSILLGKIRLLLSVGVSGIAWALLYFWWCLAGLYLAYPFLCYQKSSLWSWLQRGCACITSDEWDAQVLVCHSSKFLIQLYSSRYSKQTNKAQGAELLDVLVAV